MHVDYGLALKRLTNNLLNKDATHQQMLDAAEQLYQLLIAASQMSPDESKNKSDLFLPEGKAIAPTWAAMCIRDFYRTRQFLLGLIASIRSIQPQFPDRPIHVLYAGTGPFATLALPLTSMFTPEEVQFTLLEIHPESIALLRKTLAAFKVNPFIRSVVQTDASTYQAREEVHIVVLETMQQALQNEPQVAITRNLAPQLAPGGLLIPEKVVISTGLFNFQKTLETDSSGHSVRHLHPVFELSACSPPGDITDTFTEVMVDIPENFEAGFTQFCLFTEIRVFQNILLRTGDSGLTQPKVLLTAAPEAVFHTRKVGIQYRTNQRPGFHIRIES